MSDEINERLAVTLGRLLCGFEDDEERTVRIELLGSIDDVAAALRPTVDALLAEARRQGAEKVRGAVRDVLLTRSGECHVDGFDDWHLAVDADAIRYALKSPEEPA